MPRGTGDTLGAFLAGVLLASSSIRLYARPVDLTELTKLCTRAEERVSRKAPHAASKALTEGAPPPPGHSASSP